MFQEYKEHKGIDVPMLSKILVANRKTKYPILVFETPDLETGVAVVEFDLILAFTFLVNRLAEYGVAMDGYIADLLKEGGLSEDFNTRVMERFVRFRRANGIDLKEDALFAKTKDFRVYEIEGDLGLE
ncbi:MAG: hypothetical protein AB7F66_10930 [Bacteriovoracia bacterium]